MADENRIVRCCFTFNSAYCDVLVDITNYGRVILNRKDPVGPLRKTELPGKSGPILHDLTCELFENYRAGDLIDLDRRINLLLDFISLISDGADGKATATTTAP